MGQGSRVTEQHPTYWLAYIWLGSAYREKKMYSQALEQFAKGRQLSGDQPVLISLSGHALAVSADARGTRKALADLQHLSQNVVSSAPRRPLESPLTTPRAEQGSSAPKSFPSHRRKGIPLSNGKVQSRPSRTRILIPWRIQGPLSSVRPPGKTIIATARWTDWRTPRASLSISKPAGLLKETQCAQAPLRPSSPRRT